VGVGAAASELEEEDGGGLELLVLDGSEEVEDGGALVLLVLLGRVLVLVLVEEGTGVGVVLVAG
jgi:hypothetical protein